MSVITGPLGNSPG